MPRNVEIKAVAKDFQRQSQLASQISDTPGQVIEQHDTFYLANEGRLKLRVLAPDKGELIYYERADRSGPKTSNYSIYPADSPAALNQLLSSALGVRGVVRKKRTLYLAGSTRIHLDEIDGLGHFLELEVVLKDGQTPDEGRQIAVDLMKRLDIEEQDLIQGAYIDLLTEKID